MSEHVLPPLLTEDRVRELRDQAYHGYVDDWTGDTHDEIAALCDAWLASRKPREGSVAKPLRQNHPMWDLLQAYGDACQDMGEHQGLQQIAHREADVASVNAAWDALWAYIEHPADVPLPPSAGEE